MWNPDQTYAAEQARRMELYAEAELLRAARGNDAKTRLVVRIGRLLEKIGAQLAGEIQAPSHVSKRL
jgi:hypothetical protein